VKFRLNNETSDIIGYHDLWESREGSSIYVREILEEEAEEGPDRVSIRFYPRVCPATTPVPEVTEEVAEEMPEEPVPELYGGAEEAEEISVPEEKGFWSKLFDWLRNIFS